VAFLQVIIRQGEQCENAFFLPPPRGQCGVRVLREVVVSEAPKKTRVLEIGSLVAPAYISTQFHGGVKVRANTTYLVSESGVMFTIPWAKLYECLSMNCLTRVNQLVDQLERCSFKDDSQILHNYVSNRDWEKYKKGFANEVINNQKMRKAASNHLYFDRKVFEPNVPKKAPRHRRHRRRGAGDGAVTERGSDRRRGAGRLPAADGSQTTRVTAGSVTIRETDVPLKLPPIR